MMKKKTCNRGGCEVEFVGLKGNRQYCSPECQHLVKLAGKRKYREDNRETAQAGVQRWKNANRSRVRELEAAYRDRNREEIQTRNKAWRDENADRKRELDSNWKTNNRDKVENNERRRNARKRGVANEPYTREEVLGKTGGLCYLCEIFIRIDDSVDGRFDHLAYSVDHVIALALGGGDVLNNVMPAHRSCNSSKGARLLEDLPVNWVIERQEFITIKWAEVLEGAMV